VIKTEKPWLSYGLDDGRDITVHKPKLKKKKYSTAVWIFLFLGGVGGHRLYMGQPWAALRVIFLQFFLLFFVSFILILGVFWGLSKDFAVIFLQLPFLGILIFEFFSIRPGVEKANKEIEVENEQ